MSTTAAAAASRCRSFPPACATDARVLVLGSMPGAASLTAAQYYAHPRNAFWPIMGALFGAGPELPYAARLQRLNAAGVALWDVIAACERAGSLDSAIAPDSVEANDFARLFHACPHIEQVFFNGSAAETAFRRHVRGRIALPSLHFTRLPSTSPAHAARGFEAKLAAWQVVKEAAAARCAAGLHSDPATSCLARPATITAASTATSATRAASHLAA